MALDRQEREEPEEPSFLEVLEQAAAPLRPWGDRAGQEGAEHSLRREPAAGREQQVQREE